jgi:hypothetical protein
MSDSNFKGTIPAGVYKLTKLVYLAVDGNQFHDAPIPSVNRVPINVDGGGVNIDASAPIDGGSSTIDGGWTRQ